MGNGYNSMIMTIRLMALALIAVFMHSAAPRTISAEDAGGGSTFWFPKDEDVFFAQNNYTWAVFTAFRKDGTYVEVDRQHMSVDLSDSGRWIQTDDGNLVLCSDCRYHSIQFGSLTIPVMRKQHYDDLPAFRDGISGLLEEGEEMSFPKARVKVSIPPSFVDKLYDLPDPVPRKVLEGLSAAVDRYIQQGEANLLVLRPWTYARRAYLIAPGPEGEEWMKTELDKGEGYSVETATVRITREEFENSIAMTQPFIFYPELNDRLASQPVDILDNRGAKAPPLCGCFPDRPKNGVR